VDEDGGTRYGTRPAQLVKRLPRPVRLTEHRDMSDNIPRDILSDGDDETAAVEQVVEDVRDDIRHGQVEDDVSTVLEDRLAASGLEMRPEAVDDLAEDIENDVSS
jgi:hypothetical protein